MPTVSDSMKQAMETSMIQEDARRSKARDLSRVLPEGLAQDIVLAADRERALVLGFIGELEQELATLEVRIEAARQAERDAVETLVPSKTTVRERSNGTTVKVTTRAVTVRGKAGIEAGKVTRKLVKRKQALGQELQLRHIELSDIAKVKAAAGRGVVAAILHLAQSWQNAVPLGGVAAKLGRSFSAVPSDVVGNPLPAEALSPDGKPTMRMDGRKAEQGG